MYTLYLHQIADGLHSLNHSLQTLDGIDCRHKLASVALLVEAEHVVHGECQLGRGAVDKQVEQVATQFPEAVNPVQLDHTVTH